MIESLEELKAIRDGAPDGATHVDDLEDYVKVLNGGFYGWSNQLNEWGKFDYISAVTMRSLSDINRIIELLESKPAKEECEHSDRITHWDHHQCKSCGYVLTDSGFGCASNKWFPNIEAAKFYQRNGFLPNGA